MNRANFIFAYFEFRASLNLWLGAIRRRRSSLCCVGERPHLSTEHICLLFGYQKQRLKYDVKKASTPTERSTQRARNNAL